MPKKILTNIKLQIPAGQANPAPPVGPALGQHGIGIQDFCTQFNEATQDRQGDVVPVEITVYEDRSFNFITKTPPASQLIMKKANIQKGSSKAPVEKAGSITKDQVKEIANIKMPDLNANTVEAAMSIIEGTAKQMGVDVK